MYKGKGEQEDEKNEGIYLLRNMLPFDSLCR